MEFPCLDVAAILHRHPPQEIPRSIPCRQNRTCRSALALALVAQGSLSNPAALRARALDVACSTQLSKSSRSRLSAGPQSRGGIDSRALSPRIRLGSLLSTTLWGDSLAEQFFILRAPIAVVKGSAKEIFRPMRRRIHLATCRGAWRAPFLCSGALPVPMCLIGNRPFPVAQVSFFGPAALQGPSVNHAGGLNPAAKNPQRPQLRRAGVALLLHFRSSQHVARLIPAS